MPSSRRELSWAAFFALIGATILWGSSFIAMKIAMREVSPLLVVFSRMAVASVVFGLLWRRMGGLAAGRGDWKWIAFMAFCEPCLYFIFESQALTYTQASQAGMITSLLPVMTAVAAALFLKEKLEQRTMAGLLLAVAGVAVMSVTGEDSPAAPRPILGNFLEFVAMCCAVGYIITCKRLAVRHKPLYLTAAQSFLGMIFFSPALVFAPFPERLTLGPVLAIVFLGLGVTFVAYGLYNYGVSRAPAAKAAAFINLIPVVTCLLSRFFLDETLTPGQWLGGATTLVGVAVSARPAKRVQPSRRE
ncbi:Permease of the drug/metabolite transporter (DMT) superfamily [Desulfovibrio sp. DV]|uniref:DMT family transporter n=1 Tax=Desulfovibrio sp. DV TaxID=1844708 RepID=UPI00094B7E1B|nr:DMT family transporter [Desulfovibrio sp. DV]OLN31022.1 Permease of the drug/metabolite transporter (DMT) superfamily [Desulfovibrio sp. DV]